MTRISDRLLASIDELVAEGRVASRSDAVRQGLEGLVERRRRARIGEVIADGYRLRPQTEAEVGWADRASAGMIADEPW